jgi:hypothetical protein
MDSLKKQDDYVALSSIQNAYDDNMMILKTLETSTSTYVGSKIVVHALNTKNGFFPSKKIGEQGPYWTSLETHLHTKLNRS